jgi:hypothetical protein
MDAPLYPPAVEFVQPVDAPFVLSTRTVSLGELMTSPAAWAIVLRHAPALGLTVASPQAKPYLSNLTCQTFVDLGLIGRQAVEAINQELGSLPRNEWPRL